MTIQQIIASIAAALGLVGVVSMTLYFGTYTAGVPAPIMMDGKTINFLYTNGMQGEDLHIFLDSHTYTNGLSHAEVYLAVVNTGRAQDVELSAYFRDSSKRIQNVSLLTTVTQEYKDPVYSSECVLVFDSMIGTSTCRYAQTGTTTRQVTREVWAPVSLIQRTAGELTKETTWLKGRVRTAVEGFASEQKGISVPMRRNDIAYYKVLVVFPPNERDEFYFEALGSDGGYDTLR